MDRKYSLVGPRIHVSCRIFQRGQYQPFEYASGNPYQPQWRIFAVGYRPLAIFLYESISQATYHITIAAWPGSLYHIIHPRWLYKIWINAYCKWIYLSWLKHNVHFLCIPLYYTLVKKKHRKGNTVKKQYIKSSCHH